MPTFRHVSRYSIADRGSIFHKAGGAYVATQSSRIDHRPFCWMLVHAGPDAIIYTDIGGLIRFWNISAERLFGHSAGETVGRPLGSVIPEICCNRCWQTYIEAASGYTAHWSSAPVSVVVRRSNGEPISVEFATFHDRDRDGTLVGTALIAHDVTERFRDRLASKAGQRT